MKNKNNDKYGFKIFLSNELSQEYQQKWLIEKVIPKNQTTVLLGDEDTGKSFIAQDFSFQIQNQLNTLGKVDRTGVLYLCLENSVGLKERMEGFHLHYPNGIPIAISDAPFSITNDDDVLNLLKFCKWKDIGLVVVDTLSQAICFDDESSPKTARAVRNACNTLNANEVSVILVHHTGKNASSGARGSSILTMDFSGRLLVKKRKGELNGTMTIQKSKSDSSGRVIPFSLLKRGNSLGVEWNVKSVSDLGKQILEQIDDSKELNELIETLYPHYTSIKKDSFKKKLDREIKKLSGQGFLEVVQTDSIKYVFRTIDK